MKSPAIFLLCFFAFNINTFSQDANELQETAKTFMRQGDYDNASLVLNRALEQQPGNLEIAKDLSMAFYLQKNNAKALEIIKPLLDRDDADDQCYQIAGNIYKAMNQVKECEKIYKKGLKKFPASGALYSEYGELLLATNDAGAIRFWEKGIEADPGYSGNYYNACKYYYASPDKIWDILYGEIFLNIEPATARTAEIKNVLLDSYKKLFADNDLLKNSKGKNNFEQAFIRTINNQNSIAAFGINPESLTMIRTRFILEWFQNYSTQFPYRLFDYQQQLLQNGIFEAYDQWIFGAAQNLMAYQNWTSNHVAEYNAFNHFQKGRIFKVPTDQFYHK